MTAPEVCEISAQAIRCVLPQAHIISIPVADGGEGTAEAVIRAAGGVKIPYRVTGPLFKPVNSFYGRLENESGSTAFIETAAVCGLEMLAKTERNPEKTTSYGVGEMIKKALEDGCTKIVLCVGGSATNDAGIGMLQALGAVFKDTDGKDIIPCGGNLTQIESIDFSGLDQRLKDITVAGDVTNPLYGPNGAAFVFAPQKGADNAMVKRLDNGLRHFAKVFHAYTGTDIAGIPGGGAAGGMAAGLLALGRAALSPGIDLVLDTVRFNEKIKNAFLLLTGEGKTDRQTLAGKAVLGVIRRAVKYNVPVIVISGSVDDGVDEELYREGAAAVFSCCRLTEPFEEIRKNCPDWLRRTVMNVMRVYFAVTPASSRINY
jgi:glycerate kinase